jgi:hypothetical protein
MAPQARRAAAERMREEEAKEPSERANAEREATTLEKANEG